jgi:hypothetical protein
MKILSESKSTKKSILCVSYLDKESWWTFDTKDQTSTVTENKQTVRLNLD